MTKTILTVFRNTVYINQNCNQRFSGIFPDELCVLAPPGVKDDFFSDFKSYIRDRS